MVGFCVASRCRRSEGCLQGTLIDWLSFAHIHNANACQTKRCKIEYMNVIVELTLYNDAQGKERLCTLVFEIVWERLYKYQDVNRVEFVFKNDTHTEKKDTEEDL